LAAAAVVDFAATPAAFGLGATADTPLSAASTGIVSRQAVIRTRAVEAATAPVRERAALIGIVRAREQCGAAARPGRVDRRLTAHVAGARATAVNRPAATIVELRAAFPRVVAAAGARCAAGIVGLTYGAAGAFALYGTARVAHAGIAGRTARRKRAAGVRGHVARLAGAAIRAARMRGTARAHSRAASRAAGCERAAHIRRGVASFVRAARGGAAGRVAAVVVQGRIALTVACLETTARASRGTGGFLAGLAAATAGNRAAAAVVERAALTGIEATFTLLATSAGRSGSLGAAHSAGAATAIDGGTATIR